MPSQDAALASLSSAADAARQAYITAQAANPGADLSALYQREMEAADLWSEAEDKALEEAAPGLAATQAELDNATAAIRGNLNAFKNLVTCVNGLDSLVEAATKLAGFFA